MRTRMLTAWAFVTMAAFGAAAACGDEGAAPGPGADAAVDAPLDVTNTPDVGVSETSTNDASDAAVPDTSVDATGDAQDSAADAGDVPIQATGDAGSSGKKRIFVTSTTTNGAFGGLLAANATCAARASAAGLGGAWKAWLSDDFGNAVTRIVDVSPWYLVDRTTLVFSTKSQMINGNPTAPLNQTENGAAATVDYWTGTDSNGTKQTAAGYCQNWLTADGGVFGCTGQHGSTTGSGWTNGNGNYCNGTFALLCVEQ
jgi:hypothetical protein